MTGTSRRSFLEGTALAGLYAASGRRVRAAQAVDVIIVGSGLSGLNAALLLEGRGARVTVVEGTARLGGRVHSADDIRLQPEYGASQIGRSYARIIDTANRLGIELVAEDRGLLPFATHVRDRWIKASEWPSSDFNPLPDSLRTMPAARVGVGLLSQLNPLENSSDWLRPDFSHLDISVGEILSRNNFSQEVIDLASLSTPSMRNVSALALMQEETRGKLDRSFGGSQAPICNIKGGASRLVEAMAAKLTRPPLLKTRVACIDMTARKARVECHDGSVMSADYVIAAIPFLQLRQIVVRPNFAGRQLEAVQRMNSFGTTRAYIAIREPFWHADGLDPSFFSDGPIEMFWVIDNHKDRGEYRGMFVITGERAARLDTIAPVDVPDFLLKELARLRPAAAGKVEVLTWNSWSATPLVGCCRHIYGPGQIERFARDMIKPWHRLHVAGEHTRRTDFGMEAAMESGERVALEILIASA